MQLGITYARGLIKTRPVTICWVRAGFVQQLLVRVKRDRLNPPLQPPLRVSVHPYLFRTTVFSLSFS